jgi:hypothetical protein
MNTGLTSEYESEKSPWTRFGFGFERQSASSPSTHQAQVFFLKLLAERRPEIVSDLFDAYYALAEFASSRRAELVSIQERIEPTSYASETAIRILLPGLPAIQCKSAAAVSSKLSRWAKKWNLIDEWCLDHGLATLREQLISCQSGGSPHGRFTHEAWETALYLGGSSEAIFSQNDINQELRKGGLSDFTFGHDLIDTIEVEGPFFKSVPEFRREVIQRFEIARGREVRGLRRALDRALESYLKQFCAQANSLELQETRVRWKDGDLLTG